MAIERSSVLEPRPGRSLPRPSPGLRRVPPAVILAAGAGSRLRQHRGAPPKPLTELLGIPLIERAIRSCREAGVDEFIVVVGYSREQLIPYLYELPRRLGVQLRVAENPRWPLGNGSSVLAAEPYVRDRFFLIMADHVFSPPFLERLLAGDRGHACALVVDRDVERVHDLAEASKVRLSSGRITAVGKQLTRYDGVDTGVFLCRPALFDALRLAAGDDDHTLGGAVQLLADRAEAAWTPADGLFWLDVDTPADLAVARARLLAGSDTWRLRTG